MTRRSLATLGLAVLLATAGGLLLFRKAAPVDPSALRVRATALSVKHRIRVEYGDPEQFEVPPYPKGSGAIPGTQMRVAELAAVEPALAGLEQSLATYPPGFVSSLIRAIFLCGGLLLDGAEAGGTYGPAWLVLVATPTVGERGIFQTARLGVHHELSSLVWNRSPQIQLRWRALLPTGWSPARTAKEALGAYEGDGKTPHDGFLSSYGATTEENDFNVYAETAFTEAAELVKLAQSDATIAAKVALLIQAYEQIDARMGAVFQRLSLARFRRDQADSGTTVFSVPAPLVPTGQVVDLRE
ncbi:MAG TPA: hypothetical protein VFQ61_20930 [Polyangiaceae bacterium]|nr:hypothetical protein [Polyangiaceae bacterium]